MWRYINYKIIQFFKQNFWGSLLYLFCSWGHGGSESKQPQVRSLALEYCHKSIHQRIIQNLSLNYLDLNKANWSTSFFLSKFKKTSIVIIFYQDFLNLQRIFFVFFFTFSYLAWSFKTIYPFPPPQISIF